MASTPTKAERRQFVFVLVSLISRKLPELISMACMVKVIQLSNCLILMLCEWHSKQQCHFVHSFSYMDFFGCVPGLWKRYNKWVLTITTEQMPELAFHSSAVFSIEPNCFPKSAWVVCFSLSCKLLCSFTYCLCLFVRCAFIRRNAVTPAQTNHENRSDWKSGKLFFQYFIPLPSVSVPRYVVSALEYEFDGWYSIF